MVFLPLGIFTPHFEYIILFLYKIFKAKNSCNSVMLRIDLISVQWSPSVKSEANSV